MNTSRTRIEPGEYTGRELRDLAPELYTKKFRAWGGDTDYVWWDPIYEDLKCNPQYYHPKVVEFFETWQPQIKGEDVVSQHAYHALAEHYMGVITSLYVSEFDLYPKKISLSFDIAFTQWARDQTFPTDNPLFVNVFMDWIEDADFWNLINLSSGSRDAITHCNDARHFAIEWYMQFTGLELEPMVRGWKTPEEAVEFGGLFEQWVDDTIEPMLDEFIYAVESAVLSTLEAEYEYRSSEDCFLETYVYVDEDDLEEIENEHE